MRRGQQIAFAADKKRVPIKRILIPVPGGGLIDGIDDRTNRAGEAESPATLCAAAMLIRAAATPQTKQAATTR